MKGREGGTDRFVRLCVLRGGRGDIRCCVPLAVAMRLLGVRNTHVEVFIKGVREN